MPPSSLRNFDLNLLKVFDAVMAERSLTSAAHQLALTQPAVSNALRRLRETLGDELLVRQGRNLVPTPRAQELWPAVRDTLLRLQTAIAPNVFDPASASTTFVLTMADATAAELMPPLVDLITKRAPDVSLRVVPLTTRDPRRLLDEGHADLAIGNFPAVMADLTARAQSGERVPFFAPSPVSGRLCVRHAQGASSCQGPTHARSFLRRATHAGQLFRKGLWLH